MSRISLPSRKTASCHYALHPDELPVVRGFFQSFAGPGEYRTYRALRYLYLNRDELPVVKYPAAARPERGKTGFIFRAPSGYTAHVLHTQLCEWAEEVSVLSNYLNPSVSLLLLGMVDSLQSWVPTLRRVYGADGRTVPRIFTRTTPSS